MKIKKIIKIVTVSLILAGIITAGVMFIMSLDPDFYNGSKANRYKNNMIKALEKTGEIELGEIFTFDFDRAYVMSEPYFGGKSLSNAVGVNITDKQVRPGSDESRGRIVFVDEKGDLVYEFRYDNFKFGIKEKSLIIYPDTKIRACEVLIGVITVQGIEFMGGERGEGKF